MQRVPARTDVAKTSLTNLHFIPVGGWNLGSGRPSAGPTLSLTIKSGRPERLFRVEGAVGAGPASASSGSFQIRDALGAGAAAALVEPAFPDAADRLPIAG